MNDAQWQDVVGRIKDDFDVEASYEEPLDPGPGKREGIIFSPPRGKMKLERVTRPLVLGTHAVGSKRIGSATKVAYDYSETETSQAIKAYRWGIDEWIEMKGEDVPFAGE